MSLESYLKGQGYSLKHSSEEVRLEKELRINVPSIVVGVIGMGIMIYFESLFLISFFYVLAGVILLVVLRFNF